MLAFPNTDSGFKLPINRTPCPKFQWHSPCQRLNKLWPCKLRRIKFKKQWIHSTAAMLTGFEVSIISNNNNAGTQHEVTNLSVPRRWLRWNPSGLKFNYLHLVRVDFVGVAASSTRPKPTLGEFDSCSGRTVRVVQVLLASLAQALVNLNNQLIDSVVNDVTVPWVAKGELLCHRRPIQIRGEFDARVPPPCLFIHNIKILILSFKTLKLADNSAELTTYLLFHPIFGMTKWSFSKKVIA